MVPPSGRGLGCLPSATLALGHSSPARAQATHPSPGRAALRSGPAVATGAACQPHPRGQGSHLPSLLPVAQESVKAPDEIIVLGPQKRVCKKLRRAPLLSSNANTLGTAAGEETQRLHPFIPRDTKASRRTGDNPTVPGGDSTERAGGLWAPVSHPRAQFSLASLERSWGPVFGELHQRS